MIEPTQENVLKVITALRESDIYIKTIYTQGGCYQFYLFLKVLFPNAIPLIDCGEGHIGTLIGGFVYDINGLDDFGLGQAWKIMTQDQLNDAESWSFGKHQWLNIGDCPNCGEGIPV